MTPRRILAATATTAALVLAPLAPALGQDGTADGAAPDAAAPGTGTDMAVPDALLDSFVTAALDVSSVAEAYQGRIEAAEDDAARQQLANEARQEMVAAVEQTEGISVEEYVAISEAAQTDQALNQRVMDLLAERSGAETNAE